MFDTNAPVRAKNLERTAAATAREVMKPYRKKVAEWNGTMARINTMKERAERRLASSDVWKRQANYLVALVAEERRAFLDAVQQLPPRIAACGPVTDIDVATKRLLTNLAALEPVQKD